MAGPTPAPLDLHDVLVGRREALRAAVVGLDALDVGLWEGGVRVVLTVQGQTVALKLRPRDAESDDEAAYARTPSASAALELTAGDALERSTERVVVALLRWIERMDQGRLVLRKHAPDEVEPEPPPDAASPPPCADDPGAIAPVRLDDLARSGWEAQRAVLGGWHVDDTVLVLLGAATTAPGAAVTVVREARADGVSRVAIGGDGVVDHPELAAVLAAADGAAITVELGPGDVGHLPRLLAAGARAVVVRGDLDVDGLCAAASAAGLDVLAWLPTTAAVLGGLADRVAALRAAGATVCLAPASFAGLPSDANPLDLGAVEVLEVALVGLPTCFAPSRPHLATYLPSWRLLDRGTRFGVVCKFCTARERCPGVDPEHLERWRTRGMVPALDV